MAQGWKSRYRLLVLISAFAIPGISTLFPISQASTQIVPDGTLGAESSIVTPQPGSIDVVSGGAKRGANLFHSFAELSVVTGRTAYFNNDLSIQNIISRVTGGSVSNIDGLIKANGTANLFLINPHGIVFGANAALRVGGSFVASTASSLKFIDGTEFSATAPQTSPLLTVSVPIGLQFGDNPGGILNQSQATDPRGNLVGLQVLAGKTLALVGGNVSLDGGIVQAPGGRVELGGLSGVGTVGLNTSDGNFSLNFPVNAALASVSLADSADVNVASRGGGSIAVNAQNIDVLGGSSLRAGISLNSQADGAQPGDITLKATGTLNIKNSFIYNAVFGAGNGGNLLIDTGKLIVGDGIVTTATVSQGRAGDLIVKAKDSVELTSSNTSNGTVSAKIPVNIFGSVSDFPVLLPIGLFSASFDAKNILPRILNLDISLPTAGGNAGNLRIETGRLMARDGAVISAGTTTAGNAGDLTVKADSIDLDGTSANLAPLGFEFLNLLNKVPSGLINGTTDTGSGASGKLFIETRQLIVRNGARLATNTVGKGGELIVNAESVELSGTSADGFPSLLSSATRGFGDGSPLTIKTKRLSVSNGAIISAGTTGSGKGGELTINATESVKLIGTSTKKLSDPDLQRVLGVSTFKEFTEGSSPSGVITGTFGEGNADSLKITTGQLSIQGGAQASVSSLGKGNAGSLIVNASSIELSGTSVDRPDPNEIVGRSLLTTAVGKDSIGKGGDITVNTNSLTINDGAALAASTSGQGAGGDITLTTGKLALQNGAKITVSSTGLGSAGSLNVNANSIDLNNAAEITADTTGGGGNITVGSPLLLLSNQSSITTNAQGNGIHGGNIDIDTDFLIAFENSDISADSTNFRGGLVKITAQGIFGTEFRNQATPESDITAKGGRPEFSGTVQINTLGIEPTQGLANVPVIPVDTQVAQGCYSGGSQAQSEFMITGRGGLPPNPGEALNTDAVQVDLVTLNPQVAQSSTPAVSTHPTSPSPDRIVEATGWIIDAGGNVLLTANAPTLTPHSSWQRSADCRAFNQHPKG